MTQDQPAEHHSHNGHSDDSADPFSGRPAYSIESTLELAPLRHPNVLSYLKRKTLSKPDPNEWLDTLLDVDGEAVLQLYLEETTVSPRYHYVIGVDQYGFIVAWKSWNESFTRGLHARPRPASLEEWVQSGQIHSISHRTGLPQSVAQVFSASIETDQTLNEYKPSRCSGCGYPLYVGNKTTNSETDFRVDRKRSTEQELVWECVTCRDESIVMAPDNPMYPNE